MNITRFATKADQWTAVIRMRFIVSVVAIVSVLPADDAQKIIAAKCVVSNTKTSAAETPIHSPKDAGNRSAKSMSITTCLRMDEKCRYASGVTIKLYAVNAGHRSADYCLNRLSNDIFPCPEKAGFLNTMAIQNPKTEYSKRVRFDKPDECFTPEYAIHPLLPYLTKNWKIWDCAFGSGRLKEHFSKYGFEVVGENSLDFLNEDLDCDVIITNPPYSKKDKFLKRAFEIRKPFAFLLPITTLEGQKRGKMFKDNGIQLLIPNRRINFEIPSGKKSSWFATAWFCWKLNLPKDLTFVELNTKGCRHSPGSNVIECPT